MGDRSPDRLIGLLYALALALLVGPGAADPLPGDIDGDGDVDFVDFVAFAENFGRSGGEVLRPAPDGIWFERGNVGRQGLLMISNGYFAVIDFDEILGEVAVFGRISREVPGETGGQADPDHVANPDAERIGSGRFDLAVEGVSVVAWETALLEGASYLSIETPGGDPVEAPVKGTPWDVPTRWFRPKPVNPAK